MDHESNADESEDLQDSECALDEGCSPGGDLFKRVAANKIHRQHLSQCVEEPGSSHIGESPYEPINTGDITPMVHDENFGAHQRSPRGLFEVRPDSSLGGSAKVSDGQVTARLQIGKVIQEDTACSVPAGSPQVSQTGAAADRPVLSPIKSPPSIEQQHNQSSEVIAVQAQTQSTEGAKCITFPPI